MPNSPDQERWPVWVCEKHGPVCSHVCVEHDDEYIHTPTVPCNRIAVETDVVPALVAERLAAAARRYVNASYEGIQTPEDRLEVEQALEAYEGNPNAS